MQVLRPHQSATAPVPHTGPHLQRRPCFREMRSAPILAFFILLLACTEARQLLKEKESEKPKQKESDDHDQKGPDNKPGPRVVVQ